MVQNKTDMTLEIILVLIKKESHLREIARTLKESHSTVLRKLKELAENNIVDYKEEGKNKIFFLKNNLRSKNYVYSAEIYKLSKILNQFPEFSVIFEDIKKKARKGMVILFGSYAKGIAKKDSDIDIYIETNDRNIKKELSMINSRLSIKIGKFDYSSLLIKEIIKNHIIIRGVEEFYEKNKFFEKD